LTLDQSRLKMSLRTETGASAGMMGRGGEGWCVTGFYFG
jgi:hypothetical protein